jgi:hypothetical protein
MDRLRQILREDDERAIRDSIVRRENEFQQHSRVIGKWEKLFKHILLAPETIRKDNVK